MKQGVLCKSGQMRRTSSDGPSVSRWLPLLCAAAVGLGAGSAVHADVLSVLTPNGGEVWAPGSVQTVSWSVDTGSGTGEVGAEVKIELWQGDSVSSVLAWIVAAADGSFSWSIPSSQAEGSDYRVKVYSRTDLSVADFSDGYFTIQAPTLTVESPNGGETWYGGETQSITWSTDGDVGAEVKIELWAGGALDRVLAWVVAAGDGSYSWAIPSDVAAGCGLPGEGVFAQQSGHRGYERRDVCHRGAEHHVDGAERRRDVGSGRGRDGDMDGHGRRGR